MKTSLTTTLLCAAVSAACGSTGNDPMTPETGLTGAEAQALAVHLADVGTFEPTEDRDCAVTGVAQVGPSSYIVTSSSFRMMTSVTYLGCRGGSAGGTFTVDGSVEVLIDLGLDPFGKVISIDGSYSGALTWKLGDRSGTCLLAITSTGVPTGSLERLEVGGQLCEREVALNVPRG